MRDQGKLFSLIRSLPTGFGVFSRVRQTLSSKVEPDRTVFVYGSLKRGEANHAQIADQEFVGEGTVRDYGLFAAHERYPYAVPLRGGRIAGEVYRLAAERAAWLDEFEGSDGYRPEPVWVRLATGQLVVAEIYAVTPEQIAAMGGRRLAGANWQGPRELTDSDE